MKYDLLYGKAKDWKEEVPKAYHSFEEVFTQKDFDKLPESRPWDHAIELAPDFKPVRTRNSIVNFSKSNII